jgi:hypothetical protein
MKNKTIKIIEISDVSKKTIRDISDNCRYIVDKNSGILSFDFNACFENNGAYKAYKIAEHELMGRRDFTLLI